jgi:3-deoxy-D-manno-octulosonate 8-phosphate phosphatase (KDO 8-P phosphatase)
MMNVLEILKDIDIFIFDVDGVLTDSTLLLLPNGAMCRKMNIKDGYAMQLAIKKKYKIIIISGGSSVESEERLKKLGITEIFMQVQNKEAFLKKYCLENNISLETALYMGDDIPDLAAMKLVKLPSCPADAATEIKEIAQYISPINGGAGCVRDVIEKVLKLQHNWNDEFLIQSL